MKYVYILMSYHKLAQFFMLSKTLATQKIVQQVRIDTSKSSSTLCKTSPLLFLLNEYKLGFIQTLTPYLLRVGTLNLEISKNPSRNPSALDKRDKVQRKMNKVKRERD